MTDRPVRLHLAATQADWSLAHTLCREYAQGLGVDLAYQGFEAELAGLAQIYCPPAGRFLLATVDGMPGGCGALRPRGDVGHGHACEMKRLFVRPSCRGLGLGRTLARSLIEQARAAGYAAMLLDTLDEMHPARELYASLGFEEVPPYYPSPVAGTHYLRIALG